MILKRLDLKDHKCQMKEQYDFSKGRKRTLISSRLGKIRITIRTDNDILDWFHDKADAAGGGNYQSLINEALRQYVGVEEGRLEATLREG
jgi:uncharacterized protein (DUF4415 family)